jgi:integrase
MTDAELRGDNLWQLPGSRVKNGRAHDVPLSEAARDVLASVKRAKAEAGFVFSTNGETAVSGFAKAHKHLAEAMVEIASKEAGEPVEIARWTYHDLRRSAATGMARLGVAVRTTEAVLNHVSGTGGGIVAVYQRHDHAAEKREALEAWSRYVLSLTQDKPGNVIDLAEAQGGLR